MIFLKDLFLKIVDEIELLIMSNGFVLTCLVLIRSILYENDDSFYSNMPYLILGGVSTFLLGLLLMKKKDNNKKE